MELLLMQLQNILKINKNKRKKGITDCKSQ